MQIHIAGISYKIKIVGIKKETKKKNHKNVSQNIDFQPYFSFCFVCVYEKETTFRINIVFKCQEKNITK